MILKSVRLENIRSYVSEKIEFPSGSTLLCGDIGSGKSTILLAVEFALFGIMKGSVSGGSLLRNGSNSGSVELCIEIDRKPLIIKRGLKRQKAGIQQDSGYLIFNDIKKEGTAIELKAWILDHLGYPKELLSKSKSLIFRYTVYTPQEEMKHILFEDKEARLNTLRKVFGIDKYKRIRENCIIYTRALKERKKEYEGRISDLEERKKQRDLYADEISKVELEIMDKKPLLENLNENLDKKREEIKEIEEKIKKSNDLKRQIDVLGAEVNSLAKQAISNSEEMKQIESQIEKLVQELEGRDINNLDELSNKIIEKQKICENSDSYIIKINSKIAEFNAQTKQSESIKERVSKVNNCPTCLQEVSIKHKSQIKDREDKSIKMFNDEISKLQLKLKEEMENSLNIKADIESLRRQHSELDLVKLKMKNLNEFKDNLNKKQFLRDNMKKMIATKNKNKLELNKEYEDYKDIDQSSREVQEGFQKLLDEKEKMSVTIASLETQKKNNLGILKTIEEDIDKKEKTKKSMLRIGQLQHWIDEYFVNLMVTIEKQVMMRVYNEFNDVFREWFNTLIDDELISVRLDDEFTPVVEQNGYETDIVHLSGGEKTSCALAYRLALNKVINDVISSINTKDIIILDEPTDGFSTEQLDKVRDVLGELDIAQVVIVSHESKIESFVDNIVRVSKDEHVSKVFV